MKGHIKYIRLVWFWAKKNVSYPDADLHHHGLLYTWTGHCIWRQTISCSKTRQLKTLYPTSFLWNDPLLFKSWYISSTKPKSHEILHTERKFCRASAEKNRFSYSWLSSELSKRKVDWNLESFVVFSLRWFLLQFRSWIWQSVFAKPK